MMLQVRRSALTRKGRGQIKRLRLNVKYRQHKPTNVQREEQEHRNKE